MTGASPIVDTQSVRREIVLNSETLSTLPATRGYGSALATVPALNIGGVAGAGATTAPTTPQMMFFTAHGGASGEGRVMTNGLTVAAPFGGGGVSDVTYDTANAEEMQVLISGGLGEAETGGPSINIVPKSGGNQFRGSAFYSTSGDWATSNNLDDRAAQLRHHAAADAADELGRERQPRRPDQARSPVVLRQRPRLGQRLGRRRHLRQPLCRRRVALGLRGRRVDRGAPGGGAEDLRRPPHRAGHAAEPRDVLARLSAPLRRIDAARGRRRLPPGGRRLGGHRAARSAPTPCRPKRSRATTTFPYNTTQATYSAPLSSRTLIEAGYSRFAYGYARFGMAAPDGLMDLIPVTEQTGIYGRPNFSYRGVFDPLDFGFNDNDALNSSWRAVDVLRHRRAQHQGRLQRLVHRSAQRTRAEPHAAALHVQCQRPDAACTGDGNACARCRSRTSWRRAGTSTIARRRSGCIAQDQWTVGRLTLQGGIRYDRAWSWAPAEGNGTTETSRFNPQPISFERTVSVRGYNDITPRFGVAYDLFGNGKTALKVNGGKYLEAATGDVIYSSNNPAARIITRIGPGRQRRARLDRRQPQLRRRLRSAEPGGAGQPRHRRRPVRGRSAATT